jgi:hypothetical protein
MGTPTLDKVLQDSLYRMPYSSVTPFYLLLTAHVPDPRFGNACVWQSKAVADDLIARGLTDVRFLNDRRHLATVARCNGELYLFDPYLLHRNAINLSEVLREGANQTYRAFPICKDAHGQRKDGVLEVQPSSDRREVTLRYRQFAVAEDRYLLRHRFTFSVGATLERFPSLEDIRHRLSGLLFHPEQTTLSVRVLNRKRGSISQVFYPVAQYHGDPSILPDRLRVDVSDGWTASFGTTAFRREVSRMSDEMGCSPSDLIDFLLGGVSLYERNAPRTIARRSDSAAPRSASRAPLAWPRETPSLPP